jgi:hypothetical protein
MRRTDSAQIETAQKRAASWPPDIGASFVEFFLSFLSTSD